MFLSLARVIKFSLQDIFRNVWLSLVTIMILVLALFTVNMLLVVKVVGNTAVGAIKEKIDINLFLKSNAKEDDILILKAKIANLNEVKEVKYISKDEALEVFRKKHENNPEILESLRELGSNPLAPTLVIKPADLDTFSVLTDKINSFDDEIIESRNFSNYKLMLNKINAITKKVTDAGIFLSSIFILITILVIYNSVRIAIYTHRHQITIMKLVGASNSFIQMPFLISSVIYTFIGVLILVFLFYPLLSLLQPYLETFFVGYNINLIDYFYSNAFSIFGSQFLIGSLINILASYVAVKKYSKV